MRGLRFQFCLVAICADTQVAAHHVLVADEHLELLGAFPAVQVLVVVGPHPAYGEVKPVACNVIMDGGDFKAEHHPLVVDGLVLFQEVFHRLVDGFGCPALYHMAYPDGRSFHPFTREQMLCRFPNGLNKGGMGDGDFVVLAEHGNNAVLPEMLHGNFLGVGFDERQLGIMVAVSSLGSVRTGLSPVETSIRGFSAFPMEWFMAFTGCNCRVFII